MKLTVVAKKQPTPANLNSFYNYDQMNTNVYCRILLGKRSNFSCDQKESCC